MGQSGRPLEGCKVDIGLTKTDLGADGEAHLFKSGFIPLNSFVQADFAANEADYDGYVMQTVAAWHDPTLAGVIGYAIYATTILTFAWAFDTDGITNSIGGYWIQDGDGIVRGWALFDNPVSMDGPDKVLPLTPVLVATTNG